ncbi:PilC/PilY family type IV pilus protein [Aliikangiella maris]|uniref:PilC/PilY family type IV pilus protein n=2 Tax=Aliikangiella maris TaxID=3162458 RepID=A0ABV3MJ93_9GAMM
MKRFKFFKSAGIGGFLYSFFMLQAAIGDDTEIFFAKQSNTDTIIPNVMFIIDTSGSMTNYPEGSSQTRIQIVKDVMNDVLTEINNVNVGLMRFNKGDTNGDNSAEGGPVLYPATYIDEPADPTVTKIISNGNNDASQVGGAGTVTLNGNELKLGEAADSYVAVRFESLLIPQGATISSANLVFTAKGDQTGNAEFSIAAELVGNASALTATDFNLSSRDATTTTPVTWKVINDWKNGDSYSSSDITTIVQEVVDQSDWCGNNSIVFLVKGTGSRSVYSLEGSVADSNDANYYPAPKLHLKFENNLKGSAKGCIGGEVTSQVSSSRHDWERGGVKDNWYDSSDLDLYYGNNGTPVVGVGVSFTGINIPSNATIKEAYLDFTPLSDEGSSGSVFIKGVNLGDPNPRSYEDLYNNLFSTGVNWPLGVWVTDVVERTPNIALIVQSIVANKDWELGNTMSFFLEGVSGHHMARAYENSASKAPKLYIRYEGVYQPGVITKREELKTVVSELPADGYTPISDVMAEAGLYFRGGPVTYGIDRDNQRVNRTSHIDSWENTGTLVTPPPPLCTLDNYSASGCAPEKIIGNPNYKTPIKESCQTNHIVFLTDGYPTSHHQETNDAYADWSKSTCSSSNFGSDCAVKIAGYLHNNDQNNLLPGKQSVTTHTIGFDIDFQLLEDMASAGGGGYYTANNKSGLVDAITSIVASIVNVNTSFVSSGVSINQYNRRTHNEELYFSLFSPASGNVWPGNIKRYKLVGNSIVDVNDTVAVDSTNAQFLDSAKSWWSSSKDGADVNKGGVAEKLGYQRNVFTNISGSDLTAPDNRVKDGNSSVTEGMLGATDADDRKTILNWAQGLDVDSATVKSHNLIGDPLHSQPTLVVYNTGSSTSPTYDTKVYVGTNHGFLHSFNSQDGTENWSFIPQRLLKLLTDLQKGAPVAHAYGLDGSISIYMSDENNNGVVDTNAGEKAYLYIGMRRGGNAYYGLDISNPNKPQLLFKIDPNSSNFGKLGQTWSKPEVGKMNIGGVDAQPVIIFGGGYDTVQDTAGTGTTTSSQGNRVYIANAKTGAYIWDSSKAIKPSGSLAGDISTMDAVPSDVTAFDIDDDGLIDHIYASDMKAQIFRFDIDNKSQSISGGRIAHLQTATDIQNNRRFYYKPDVALIRLKQETFLSVSIGSGYRAHPLDENITDHFYMIKDKGVLVKKFDMDIAMSDLLDVTDIIGFDSQGNSIPADKIKSTNKKGWYIGFSYSGEKVIQSSITVSNTVIFSTYLPPGSSSNVCEAASGSSRLYTLNVSDGNPYIDTNYDGKIDKSDREQVLKVPGIAPPPQAIIGKDGKLKICIGLECKDPPEPPQGVVGLRWRTNN